MADAQKVIRDAASQLMAASKEMELRLLQSQGDLERIQLVLHAIRDACEHDYKAVVNRLDVVQCRNCFRITLRSDV